jgi:hypothetical protein
MRPFDLVLENVRLALASGADPAMLLAVALSSISPRSIEEAFAELEARKAAIITLVAEGPGDQERRPAELGPEFSSEPELGKMRPDLGDHEIRGKLLFRDLLGRKSFFQVASFAIAGLDLTAEQGEFLDHSGVLTQLLDPHIWGLAVARRIGARGANLAHALIGGLACLCTTRMTGQPAGAFIRFLDHAEEQIDEGMTLVQVLDSMRARGERIPGVGRPVAGPDERVPEIKKLASRYHLDKGKSFQLALEVDGYFAARGKPRINSAGLQGALLRDLGFSPTSASALCMIYFVLPVLANAVYLEDRAPARASHLKG